MATMENARKIALEALGAQRYFDGVQAINSAMEAWEQRFTSGRKDLPATEKLDILRKPEEFLSRFSDKFDAATREELAQMYALRARLLAGLGAQKRAVVDVGAALILLPDNADILQVQQDVLTVDYSAQTANESKTPTTIITGFLGAGKTTLLNYILQENHGKKIAVIENEFGEVGIDDKLLNSKNTVTEENVIEMNNGCICCTVRGDLIAGLKKLHKQTTGKGNPLDGIIIETTGLADPAPVAQTFFADDFVNSHMQLDGILTVVDAKHCLQHLLEQKPDGIVNEAVEQIAFADRILLNKTDLVTPEYLEEVQTEIRAINRTAHIRRTQNSVVDMDFILGIKAFSLDKVLEQVNQGFIDDAEPSHGSGHGLGHDDSMAGPNDPAPGHGHGPAHGQGHGPAHGQGHGQGHGHGHGHDGECSEACDHPSHKKGHAHDYRVASVGIERDAEVHQGKLDEFIRWLMQAKGPDLYRSKGVLAVKGLPYKFVFHAVHMQFGGKPQDRWEEGEKRCCKMVFIGKNLNREELNRKFDEILVR